ncbi:hypothetical protein [Butyrivibrio sp. AE3009]|uniref:hypothetical protein n=1 Tax=Butyrivibrio sp. AE3009 TaxID=1280666 RepID=UPI0003B76C4F|nr:hypothetical protein [Butyrivibrio sp. AE3009]
MKYTALIEIDDDRWAKRPYSITIFDKSGKRVDGKGYLTSREECYRVSDKYEIPRGEIKEEFY